MDEWTMELENEIKELVWRFLCDWLGKSFGILKVSLGKYLSLKNANAFATVLKEKLLINLL